MVPKYIFFFLSRQPHCWGEGQRQQRSCRQPVAQCWGGRSNLAKCSSLGDFSSNMMLLQVMREGGSLSLIVDSSLASVHSLGSKPLRLDGILFLGMMTTMLMMMTLINTILNTTLGCKDFFCHRLQPWSLWLVDLIANFSLSFRIPFHLHVPPISYQYHDSCNTTQYHDWP